jgi:hypothetical protein
MIAETSELSRQNAPAIGPSGLSAIRTLQINERFLQRSKIIPEKPDAPVATAAYPPAKFTGAVIMI